MTRLSADGDGQEARLLAAVTAAVQAYLDDEAQVSGFRGSRPLNKWKTAPWRVMRGGVPLLSLSWRYTN